MSEHERDEREADAELRALGKELPWQPPDEARVEALRASLLANANADAPPKSRWLAVGSGFIAGALVAAAAGWFVVVRPHAATAPTPESAPVIASATADPAQIEASSAADFDRQITRSASGVDEVVHLHGGRVRIAVGALPSDTRVRVAAGNAEIEGQGRYDVAVSADAIREVSVVEGTATVRVTGQQAVFLASGQTWKAPIVTASIATIPTPAVAPTPAPVVRAPAPVAITSTASTTRETREPAPRLSASRSISPAPIEQAAAPPPSSAELEHHFEAGYRLLKSNQPAGAAREFAAAADAPGNDALAADARYMQAIALVKADQKRDAEAALVAYLDRAPHAVRRGRAAVMLARLIAERGDLDSAHRWFESAIGDADPDVAAAARAGLLAR